MKKPRINPKDLDLHPNYAYLDLWYNVKDYENCQQVRFYTHAKRNQKGRRKGELFEIPVRIVDRKTSYRKRGISPHMKPYLRRLLSVSHKGKNMTLYCSHLVFKIGWTFPIPDPRKNVIDHISEDSLDDRRNNLRIRPASENCHTAAQAEAARNIGKRSGTLLKGIPMAKIRELAAHRRQQLAMTGHLPSLEDAIRDLGVEKGSLTPDPSPKGEGRIYQ